MPTVKLNPYLNFDGNAREAMEFYARALGGELKIMTFAAFPGAPPSHQDKVMHAHLESDLFTLMASDAPPGEKYTHGDTFSISLSGTDDAWLRGAWDKLSSGGQIRTPLEKQMWGDTFGMCVDRFGVQWLVNITAPK